MEVRYGIPLNRFVNISLNGKFIIWAEIVFINSPTLFINIASKHTFPTILN